MPMSFTGPLDGKTPKYIVLRADGTPVPPERRYLVLRIDGKDRESAEWLALQAYILNCEFNGNLALAEHLRRFFGVENVPEMKLGPEP